MPKMIKEMPEMRVLFLNTVLFVVAAFATKALHVNTSTFHHLRSKYENKSNNTDFDGDPNGYGPL